MDQKKMMVITMHLISHSHISALISALNKMMIMYLSTEIWYLSPPDSRTCLFRALSSRNTPRLQKHSGMCIAK